MLGTQTNCEIPNTILCIQTHVEIPNHILGTQTIVRIEKYDGRYTEKFANPKSYCMYANND